MLTPKAFGLSALRRSRVGRYLTYRYDYSFTPSQLGFLVSCLDATSEVAGRIVEVGCAYGHTTVFLNKHLQDRGMNKEYICVDTFSGFTEADIRHEHEQRGKTSAYRGFADASLDAFHRTMRVNKVEVGIIQGDVCEMNLADYAPISFALLDVDLYRPMSHALGQLYEALSPGGRIVVDDCQEHPLWDGALQAYEEFIDLHNQPRRIEFGQFGVIDRS